MGEGGEGIKIPSSRGFLRRGDGMEEEVMVCGDDTICLLVSLGCQSDPESNTRARGREVVSDQLCVSVQCYSDDCTDLKKVIDSWSFSQYSQFSNCPLILSF